MNIVYISKTNNVDDVLGKFQTSLPKIIKRKIARKRICFKKENENIECKVYWDSKCKAKHIERIGDIARKYIDGGVYKTIVISKEIKERPELMNKLDDLYALDGHWLFNYLVFDIVNYLLERKNKEINNSEISILVNNTKDTNVENILRIAEYVKILNIATDNLGAFKQIEDKLLDEKGIAIRVTNNKKRVLLKSDIIINLDFDEEELKKYSIPSRRDYY